MTTKRHTYVDPGRTVDLATVLANAGTVVASESRRTDSAEELAAVVVEHVRTQNSEVVRVDFAASVEAEFVLNAGRRALPQVTWQPFLLTRAQALHCGDVNHWPTRAAALEEQWHVLF